MAIGSRIVERLTELHWERNDLMEKVDGLTPQALHNLIKRDSKRSEWDEAIAEAMGVTVLWLVYGKDTAYREGNVTVLMAAEKPTHSGLISELIDVAKDINDRGLAELIGRAKECAIQYPKAQPNRSAS